MKIFIGFQGIPQNKTLQSELEKESKLYGDILQESFVDAYNNLTLKSMFMLKFVTSFMDSAPQDSVKFLLKVDDDCYVNLKALLKYNSILAKYSHTMVGHVLGQDSPVIRPASNSTERYTTKWEVPFYIYPKKETFPNALSGSGYLMRSEDLDCLYRRGLETPFVNLEDIFITGLAAKQCRLKLRSSPKFHFMGLHVCHIRHQV
jgi:beta-1,3-galactosyltransferase 1